MKYSFHCICLFAFLILAFGCGQKQEIPDHTQRPLKIEQQDTAQSDTVPKPTPAEKQDAVQPAQAENHDAAVQPAQMEPPPAPTYAQTVPDDAQPQYAKDRAQKERRFKLEDEQNTVDIFHSAAEGTVFVTQNQVIKDWRTARSMEVPAGSGTGFVWDKSGHIVTNYHVIDGGASLTVTLYNQKTYPARLVGGEPKKDIAVLKIDAPASDLHPVKLPEDGYTLSVGQKAIAIGNPFGLDHTLTVGIVSAMGRDQPGYGGVTIRDMIQTDASINPGNSGGPLLDSSGQIIGMNTLIYSKSGTSAGIGFAVPFMTIKRAVPQIIKTGHVQQIGMGVSILPDYVARQHGIKGVIIRAVSEDSPAQKAGIKGLTSGNGGIFIGDIIIGIDDKTISNYDDLYNILDEHNAGDRITVKLRREGEVLSLPVELYVLPE